MGRDTLKAMRRVKASEIVRRAIVKSGLSLGELSRRTGVDVGALSRFVRGERGVGLTTFEALAGELGLSVTPLRIWVFSIWEGLSLRRVLDVNTEAGTGHFQLNDPELLPLFVRTTGADGFVSSRGACDADEETLVKLLANLLAMSSLDGVSRIILTVRSLKPEQLVRRLETWKKAGYPLKRRRVVTR